MSSEYKLTFAVPTRNNRKIIGATLASIANQTFRDFSCIVVDGRSTDGTADYVREHYPWATVFTKDTDSGPGASRSIGLLKSRSPFVALIDSDVQLLPDWAEQQIRVMEKHPDCGIAASRVLYGKNPDILYSAFGSMNRYGVSWDGGQGEPKDAHIDVRRCLWGNTSALMVCRKAVEAVGAFDDRMFAVSEDSDFGWRVNIGGFSAIYNPAAVAMHDVHGTLDPKRDSEMLTYLLRRNRIRSMLVNYGAASVLRFAIPYIGIALVESFSGSARWSKMKALAWNVRNLRDTLKRRADVQRIRRVNDSELWPLFSPGLRGPGGDALLRLQRSALL